jgi:hypothetical protein
MARCAVNALFRHLAARLWVSALTGGLLCLGILPWFQGTLGLQWLMLAAIFIVCACVVVTGSLMNFAGMHFLRRQVKEAGVWEQVGMTNEAQTAYSRVLGQFDSFWFTPLQRRKQMPWVAGKLARFYLGRSARTPHARLWMAHYFSRFPQDDTVAELWLEQLLLYQTHSSREHQAVALVGRALHRNRAIQRRLMEFYLSCGRIDFNALMTYRKVWKAQQPLPAESLRKLSRLLVEAAVLNCWAFRVYIEAFKAGESIALEGIAAGLRWLPRDSEHQTVFDEAAKIAANQDQTRCEKQILRFKPSEIDAPPKGSHQSLHRGLSAIASIASVAANKLFRVVCGLTATAGRWVLQPKFWATLLVPIVAALVWVAGKSFLDRQDAVAPIPVEIGEAPVHSDPFTIQVAAYLRPGDAQRFVDQLVNKGLDAFWTKAASANRTWYQVKVSHFATKAAARAYGENLKSKGLIDDFYVANYAPD